MARFAVVVVTYNSAQHIGDCLSSLASTAVEEVIVIDNHSDDETCRIVRQSPFARLIENSANTGFANAVNQGVRAATAPLILLLNPDTHVVRGLEYLAGEFSDPATGGAGGLLIGADGKPQKGFMYRRLPTPAALILENLGINAWFPRNFVNWNYRCLDEDEMRECAVEQPAGAFFMFSRLAWNRVGGFDERFWPVWFEDVDFCTMLRKTGFVVKYSPRAVALHIGGHSVRLLSIENREKYWYVSLLEYAGKHYHSLTYRAVCFSVIVGAVLRGVRGLPRGGLKAFAVYGAVCRLAAGRLFRPRQSAVRSVV